MIFIIIFALIFLCSLKKRENMDLQYLGKDKGKYLRGFSAIAIVLSHMVRNTNGFYSARGAYLIQILVPSLVCIFFFYSGYGLMLSYKNKGKQYLYYFIPNFLIKLFIPSIIATVMAFITLCIINRSFSVEVLKEQVLDTGGWYVWVTVLMYIFFFAGACIFRDNLKGQLIVQSILVLSYIVIGKMLLNLSQTYYIDCPAFLLGSFVCVFKDKIDEIMNKKTALLVISGGGRLFNCRNCSCTYLM